MKALIAVADGGLGIAVARAFARAGADTVAIGPRTESFAGLGALGVGLVGCERYDAAAMESAVESASDGGAFEVCVDILGAAADDAAALEASAGFARAAARAMVARGGGTLLLVATPGATAASTALRAAFQAQFALNLRTDLHGTRVRAMELQAGAALAAPARRLAGGLDDPSPVADAAAWERAVAETAWWLATRPAHVVVNALELEAEPRG